MDKRCSSADLNLPYGFRFHPTIVELVESYLIPKSKGEKLPTNYVTDLDDFYSYDPCQLPLNKLKHARENEAYFFTTDSRQNSTDSRRTIPDHGYWKVYEENVPIEDIGFKTKLYFHDDRGNKTNWELIEYRCRPTTSSNVKSYIICRVKLIVNEKEDDEF